MSQTDAIPFSPDTMLEPIERLFERDYPSEYGVFAPRLPLADPDGHLTTIDLAYIAGGTKRLHIVKILDSYDDCLFNVRGGIHAVSRAPGNFLWIALPLDEYREGEAQYNSILEKTCRDRGVGIITVQPHGRGFSAKVIKNARRREGDHLDEYEGLRGRWNAMKDQDLAMDGFQVVDYYSRT